ncbi:hsp20/alpha crystallin family protein [Clostridium argentinense CDC 2741]|uniref:Hsp20/alpha crystallin family protein n=1 Tax=Clostridium argentinense CDC 2741 TaxID=1418104 RepID=A0A0C1U6L4_9CLOT|nr:Hsp20 family protein [Clostridium argentinense]KIE48354.1 hsp20/alpha crystallin family protein [Clostridium argentinense CDC 2741]
MANYVLILSLKTEKWQKSLENKKENYVRRKRDYGEFKRSFYIDNADENKIDASFNNGVLKITIAKTNQDNNKRKKIEIH